MKINSMSDFNKKWTEVDKEDFDKFLDNYPNKLHVDYVHFVTPPVKQWNDFSDEKIWPESTVAMEKLNEFMKECPAYGREKNRFFIRPNLISTDFEI